MESTKLPAIETEKKQCEDENQRDKKRLVGGVRDSELARMDSAAVKGHQDYLTSEVERYLSKLVCNEIQVGGTTLGSVMSFFASTDGPTNLQVLSRDSFDTVFSRTKLSETQAAHLFHRFEIGHTRTTLGQFDVQSFCLAFGTERQTHGHLSEGQPQDNRTDKSLLVLEQQRSQELALQLAEARREVRELKQQHEQQQILQARQEQKEQQQEESHYRLSLGGARDLKNRVERHIQETLEHERTQFLQQQQTSTGWRWIMQIRQLNNCGRKISRWLVSAKSNQSTLSTICLTRQSLGLWSPCTTKTARARSPHQSLQKNGSCAEGLIRAEPRWKDFATS